MADSSITRRRLLVAAIASSGVAGGMLVSRAWAQGGGSLDAESRAALTDLARRLYPHDAIEDSVYSEVLDNALEAAAADSSLADALAQAEAELDSLQPADFIDLDAESQTRALQSIEQAPYFAAIQGAVLAGVYNHPAIWELVGYGGPSWQQGGYLNRGAGEIDWLDEVD